MLSNRYSNFVRPSSPSEPNSFAPLLSGNDACRIYLEEIKKAGSSESSKGLIKVIKTKETIKDAKFCNFSEKDLFLSVQNNDVETLKQILNFCPNMLNTTDAFGWSLLMIACQANSIEAAKVLLQNGINTSVRDKAGNSAQSLVIRNRNFILADILLSYKSSEPVIGLKTTKDIVKKPPVTLEDDYVCKICKKEFPDKEGHLSSTIHNIDASKGKKVPSSYIIPASNKGYQIMLKVGWDKDLGLGPDGSGKKYPIKTVQKKDRKGLGLDKRKKLQDKKETNKYVNRKLMDKECKNSKNMEINFRRQFY